MTVRRLHAVLLMAIALTTGACASSRGVSVGSDQVYRIDVVNQMPHSMTAFWSDGGEPKMLGSVGAGRTERFVIAGSSTSTISVTARDANGAHSVGPYSVTLETGVVKRVVVR